MDNNKTLITKINKELLDLEDDMLSLVKWHDENHKSISGVNWRELEKLESLVKKIKKYINKK
jgi:predicted secreted Zn-dependent protease